MANWHFKRTITVTKAGADDRDHLQVQPAGDPGRGGDDGRRCDHDQELPDRGKRGSPALGRGSRGSRTTHATEYVNGQLAETFTLGHDVLTQHDAANGALTLIYDGHGSTRALLDAGWSGRAAPREEGGVAA